MKKQFIFSVLKFLSKRILKKYKPKVIGITGSVGKSSAKQAIFEVISPEYNTRASQKNYNTETGVPLTIIGADNPRHSVFGWLKVISQGFGLLFKTDSKYPNLLILELAADHPGDIRYLARLTNPAIGVITAISPSHLKTFGSVERVAQEKIILLNNLDKDGTAIINQDDYLVNKLLNNKKSRHITYSLGQNADLKAQDIVIDKYTGSLTFKINYKDELFPVELPNALGKPAIYAALIAAAVGIAHDVSLENISNRLKNYQTPAGRLKPLPGIKGAKLIDDSYNSSPLAVKSALEILSHLYCEGEKYAVLGDMLELGDSSEILHKDVGEEVAKSGIDFLITVGSQSLNTNEAAKEYGMNPDRIFNFDTSEEAGKFIQDRMQTNDLILIKGSRGMHMEKITKEIMAEPGRAAELLVGQEEE